MFREIGINRLPNHIDGRGSESFAHAQEISAIWGALEPILEWCRCSLEHEWRWQSVDFGSSQPGRYIFYFDDERDYLAFVMKWT